MQPFIQRVTHVRQNVHDVTYRLRDINDRLVGPQPPSPEKPSNPNVTPVRPLMAEMDKELGDLYSAVDVLAAEVSRLYNALDLPHDGPATATVLGGKY